MGIYGFAHVREIYLDKTCVGSVAKLRVKTRGCDVAS